MTIDSEYRNTDLDLRSSAPFDALNRELDRACCVLHYTHGSDGNWHSTVESRRVSSSAAETDIKSIIDVLKQLSPLAQAEFDACFLREFNIGFDCGDTWAYSHMLPAALIQQIADARCSIAMTLYPKRNPDRTPNP